MNNKKKTETRQLVRHIIGKVHSLRNNAIEIYDQSKKTKEKKDALIAHFHSRLCIVSFSKFKAVRDALPNAGNVVAAPGADNENKKRDL